MQLTILQKAKKDLREALQQAQFADALEALYNNSRGHGNTEICIAAAIQHAGVVVCKNAEQATTLNEHANKPIAVAVTSPDIRRLPVRGIVDNATIFELVKECKRVQALSEKLLSIMDMKGID